MRNLFLYLLTIFIVWIFYAIFNVQLVNHIKTSLLMIQAFPDFKVKPLDVVPSIEKKKITLNVNPEDVVVEMYLPKKFNEKRKGPAVIVASGVRLQDENLRTINSLSESLSKSGFIVFWPKRLSIDERKPRIENPETFIETIKFAKNMNQVDKERISILGFSTGASIALVSAADDRVKDDVKSFLFFGGYYSIYDYLESVQKEKMIYEGKEISWNTDKNLNWTIQDILSHENSKIKLASFSKDKVNFSSKEKDRLDRIDPEKVLKKVKAQIFIVHSKTDTSVPYAESIKLKNKLGDKKVKDFIITSSFDHVTPNSLASNISDATHMYSFFYKTLSYL